jgi:hypothetical protein
MTDPNRAFELLQNANPAPTTVVVDRPDVATFLADLEPTPQPTATLAARPPRRRAAQVAAAAFGVTLLLGAGLWLAGLLRPETEVVEPATTTTEVPATSTTSTTTTTTMNPSTIDAASRALLDSFEATFNAGDADAFMALFQPGMNREVVVDSDRRLYSPEYMRDLYLIEAALNTEIRLECTPVQDAFTCVPYRYDDLHRTLGIAATEGYPWNLRFDAAGLIRSWNEGRINQLDVDDYEREVIRPFMTWVRDNHPEVGELNPAVAGEWIVDKRDDIVAMVAAFAESRGVGLGG